MTLELRPYQIEAVERIVERGNLLLAMTMGSGKTAAAIAAIRQLRQASAGLTTAWSSPSSPPSGSGSGRSKRWDPRARVQVIDGTKAQREHGYKQAWSYHYNILHYQCLVHDIDLIVKYMPNDFVIYDECTALKGFATKTQQAGQGAGPKHTDPHGPVRPAGGEPPRGAVQHHGGDRPRGAGQLPQVRPDLHRA